MQQNSRRNHIVLFVILCLTVASTCITLFLFTSMYINQRLDAWNLEKDNNTIYLSIQHETDPRELPDNPETLQQFLTLYNELSQSDQFVYYEKSTQPLHTISGIFFDNDNNQELTEESCWTACVQISENIQSDFNLSVSSGRLLSQDDFHFTQNEQIPVLMGNSYSSLYRLGDTFDAEYLFQTCHFKVIGFLKSGDCIETSNGTILLDQNIIMPSFLCDDSPQTEEEYMFQKIHYANKVSGTIRTLPEQYDAVYADITSKLNNSPLGKFSWYSSQLGETAILWGMNLHILLVVSGISCIVLFVCTLLLLFQLLWKSSWKRLISPFILSVTAVTCGFLLSYVICQFVIPSQMRADAFYIPQYSLIVCGIYIVYAVIVLLRKKKKHS